MVKNVLIFIKANNVNSVMKAKVYIDAIAYSILMIALIVSMFSFHEVCMAVKIASVV